MKQLICYLYENQSNKQVRNVGFIKCIFLQGKVTFQIHGKGMMCNRTMGLEMFLFTGIDTGCEVRRIGIVEGNQGMVNYRVVLDDEGEELSEEYDGVILKAQNDTVYAGAWNHKEYDFTGDWVEKNEHIDVDLDECKDYDKQVECPAVDTELPKQQAEVEEETQCIKEVVECVTEQHEEKVVIEEETKEYTNELCGTHDCKEDLDEDNSNKEDSDSHKYEDEDEDEITYQKLDRQDIAKFPQREWKLANNNFLIHGYMNFKHIMCIREADRTYIGVPGVYYQREAEMARTFGFPTFHRPELSQLNLDESECSRGEDFGYWCRAISVRKDIE